MIRRLAQIALLALLIAPAAKGQVTQQQQQRLLRLSEALDQEYQRAHQRAVELARERGLPVRKQLPDGRLMFLERFEYGRPMYTIDENREAAETIGTAPLHPEGSDTLSLTGAGQTLGMWEIGAARGSHRELQGRITQRDNSGEFGTSGHATHVAGIMIGAGVRSDAQGMSYEAHLDAYTANGGNGEMARAAALDDLPVSNHSYGFVAGWGGTQECGPNDEELRVWLGDPSISGNEDWRFGYYGGPAERWDRIAYNAPHYLIVKSAGNDRGDNGPDRHCENGRIVNVNRPPDGGSDGYDSMNGRDIGKNVFAIGAVQDIPGGYERPRDVRTAGFSGSGPADDGRIKPDLVGNGTGLVSSIGNADNAYNSLSGTSMSSPNVSGSIGLLLEHQENLHGNVPLRAATLKGLLIQTADEAGPGPGPDYRFGWGLMNTTKAAHLMSLDAKLGGGLIQERTLAQSDTIRIPLEVSEAGEPLQATISWYDPPGRPPGQSLDPRDPMLVNDLDLRVIGPDDAPHHPWTLDIENPSQAAARGDNTVDNTEQVYIADPAPGRYVLEITHKGQLQEEVNGQYQQGPQDVSVILDRKPGERYTISGRVTLERDPSVGAGNVTVKLSGFATDSTTTDPDGYYRFPGLYNGDYTVTATVPGDVTFTPNSQDVTVDGSDAPDVHFQAATPGQRQITLRLNTTTIPDTLSPSDTVTVRGCLEGCTDDQSALPDEHILARDDRTTLQMTNVGGDYWTISFAVPDVTPLDFSFYAPLAERDGLGGAEDGDPHHIQAGIGNLTMPLHYFEKGENQDTTYAWRPWPEEDGVAVQFRLYLPEGLSPVLPPGVRGDDLGGAGPLREEQSRLSLKQEDEDESKPGYRLYSGVAHYPPSTTGATQTYKYTLPLSPWSEAGTRSFVVPSQDTTLHWTHGANAAPVASQDKITMREDTTATVNVLANDRDFDGDSLFVAAVSSSKHGTTRISTDSLVTYTPEADYDGSDSFTYVLSDGRGGEAEGTVKVAIQDVNDPPRAPTGVRPADTTITIEGAPDTPFVAEWDAAVDPDDGSLEYTWQLAATEAFDPLLVDQTLGNETRLETSYNALDSLLAVAGVEQDAAAMLFHRVIVSDGDSTVTGAPFPVTLKRGAVETATDEPDALPTELVLQDNYPNPFAQTTTLRYALPNPAPVRLVVFDALGRQVRVLVDRQQAAGWHVVRFAAGSLPSGVYIVRLQAGGTSQTGHMTLAQ